MKKNGFFGSLPFKLIVALVTGIILGMILDATDTNPVSVAILNVVVTIKQLASEFINFCVPLIIIGFIAPSITKLGKDASKMLVAALVLAYVSSILAAFSATAAGFGILPHLSLLSKAEGLKEVPKVLFDLSIPQIMPVMSALVLSILLGLSAAWNKSRVTTELLDEFQQIVLTIVTHFVIPVLPVLICCTFVTLGYEGAITKQLPVFLVIIIMVLVGHFIWLALLYGVAGVYSGTNSFAVLKNYGPAYLTAVGTMSSAATLPVSLECAKKSCPPLDKEVVSFAIPLFANIHLCGSVMTETFFVMAVSKMLYGEFPAVSKMILFCFLLGIFALGAPGVPGGTVMASLGLITGILGFDATGTALMLTIFALQDSFGTACNVTGDGALTLILTGYSKKKPS
jgi:Na+/H+-dicarboxylate symporter